VFLIVEIIGGLLSGSLALLADAGHMATDAAALLLALFAMRIAERAPTLAKTYGYQRTEILAALANGVGLVLIALYVSYEAVLRIAEPRDVEGGLMLAVAVAGLAANLACAWVLHAGRKSSLNVRGAFLHVMGDALGSLGAITAAVLIRVYGWTLADSLVAIGIAVLILFAAWQLVRESVDVLMESVPRHVDMADFERAIREVPGVLDVHDLHVWTLTSGYHAMSAHVDVREDADGNILLHALAQLAKQRFSIEHTTFQLEPQPPLLTIQPSMRG
jgi:cobalt-zinc-cadmium efflux system protein